MVVFWKYIYDPIPAPLVYNLLPGHFEYLTICTFQTLQFLFLSSGEVEWGRWTWLSWVATLKQFTKKVCFISILLQPDTLHAIFWTWKYTSVYFSKSHTAPCYFHTCLLQLFSHTQYLATFTPAYCRFFLMPLWLHILESHTLPFGFSCEKSCKWKLGKILVGTKKGFCQKKGYF